ncbi:unnamed protein product [Symbiodinium sp. CCMP2456]|nr:unnamed protein product [Symbiodinium sp. CCMP2456]
MHPMLSHPGLLQRKQREAQSGKDITALQGGHVEHWRGGHASTLRGTGAGFKKTLAFQTCANKQDGGSSDKGFDIFKRKAGSHCTSPHGRVFMGARVALCKVAMLNNGVEHTLATTR